jgi:hypothetical protein
LNIELKNNGKIVTPLLALSFVLGTIMGTTILLPFQALNAQNATDQIEDAPAANFTTDDVDISILQPLAQPGFGNVEEVMDREGNPVPISYNIVGGTAFAMVGDPARHALYVLIDPGIDGGALEINLPRNVLDSKASDGTDSRFVLSIDGQRISSDPTGICIELFGTGCQNTWGTFHETQTTETDRVLTILFGPQNRVIEIVGNQGTIF